MSVASQAPAPSPAVAPPPGNPRFPLFDGLRGLAVLGVLVFHVSELTGRVGFGLDGRAAELLGSAAPILFFVISGFLLYRPYVAAQARGVKRPSASRYARRRALRILPAYWTALTALAIFPGIIGVFSGDWWRYYGYLQLYSHHTVNGGIPVAWTLCVEVSFYIALPFWAAAVGGFHRRSGARGVTRVELPPLIVIALAGFVVQVAAARQNVSQLVGASLAGQCTWLALGMGLAVLSVSAEHGNRGALRLRSLASLPELCWGGAACAFAGLIALIPKGGLFGLIAAVQTRQSTPATLAKITLTGVLLTLLVLPAIFEADRRGVPRRLLAAAPVARLGLISYSFYLWHLTIAEWIAVKHDSSQFSATGLNLLAHVHTARSPLLFLVTLIASAAIATLSYRLIELPFLRRKERRFYPGPR